jgi:hypothetical protein
MGRVKNQILDDHGAGKHNRHPELLCGLCHLASWNNRSPGSRRQSDASIPVGAGPIAPGTPEAVPTPPAPGSPATNLEAQSIATTILWLRRRHELTAATMLTDLARAWDPAIEPTIAMGWLYEVG